jgi:hypothetical protein
MFQMSTRSSAILTEKFCDFAYSLQVDSQIVPLLGYNSFQIISSPPVIFSFSALWSEYKQHWKVNNQGTNYSSKRSQFIVQI